MKFIVFILLLINFYSFNSQAQEEKNPVLKYRFNADEVRSIKINGFAGNVELVPSESSKYFTVTVLRKDPTYKDEKLLDGLGEWGKHVSTVEGVLIVKVTSPQSRSYWAKLLGKKKFPKFNLKITGPSRAFAMNWLKGSIVINNWKEKGSIDMQNGSVKSTSYQGNLKIWLQSGSAYFKNHKGNLFFKSYKARVTLDNSEGDLELNNFMGINKINQFKGDVNLESRLGSIKVKKGEGKLNFKLGRAKINIDEFKGSIRGKTGQGQVTGVLKGDLDVRVRTQEGSVSFRLPRSRAQLDLGTKEGDLRVPSFLKVTRYSYIKVVKGRLRGPSRGNVFVRTKSGSIKVR